MKANNLSTQQLHSLCEYDVKNNRYVAKCGEAYVKALAEVVNIVNKNDLPFLLDDVIKEPCLDEFAFDGKNDFIYICDLEIQPLTIEKNERRNEKIIPVSFTSDNAKIVFHSSSGVAYMLTCVVEGKEHIIKIGQSRTSFEKRLASYNCGVINNWRTASTTNIKMVQSMQTIRLPFKVYICDCSNDPYILNWYGRKSTAFASPKSLAIEDIMLKAFTDQFKKKPLANIQAKPFEIK